MTEWAKYGLFELGIQRPFNVRAAVGMALALLGLFLGPTNAAFWGAAGPLVWFFVYRYALLEAGIADFNRAQIRTAHWMLTSYEPGKVLEPQGSNLRHYPAARDAVRRFQMAIQTQTNLVPRTERRRYNTAAAYEELGLLRRMMNQFPEAAEAFERALAIVDQLNNHDRVAVSRLRGLILFRLAELYHACGELEQARIPYMESLKIHQELGDQEMGNTIQQLLARSEMIST